MSVDEKTPLTKQQDESMYGSEEKGPKVTFAPQSQAYISFSGPPPDDHLTMSILTIVFCFWPLGVVALFKSLEVRNAVARGDYNIAQVASREALKYNKLSIIIGVVTLIVLAVTILLFQLFWIIPIANNN